MKGISIKVERTCEVCGNRFLRYPSAIRQGNPRFCSVPCYNLRQTVSIEKRFWPLVDKNGPITDHCHELGQCWLWTGGLTDKGYGRVYAGGGKKNRIIISAHRLSWTLTNGETDLSILHRCDNRQCCNPSHLFLGTQADNNADMKAKGRARGHSMPGSKHRGAKLNESQVIDILARHASGTMQSVLAAEYGVSRALINVIVKRKHWRHVT